MRYATWVVFEQPCACPRSDDLSHFGKAIMLQWQLYSGLFPAKEVKGENWGYWESGLVLIRIFPRKRLPPPPCPHSFSLSY